jgi:Holliday junction DNA helicase RuvA
MIAFVHGEIEEKFASSVVISAGGVGYEILLSNIDYDSLAVGDSVKIYTHHHVREQSEELFGFASLAAKRLFELLITVQGVGPKAALAILSLGDTEAVRNAIANADSTCVARASGVGKKTAEKIIIDLSDKVGSPSVYGRAATSEHSSIGTDDALDALMALGYGLADATDALKDIAKDLTTEERVKLALKQSIHTQEKIVLK